MKRMFLAASMCILFVCSALLNANDSKDGTNELQGSWMQVSKERDGKRQEVKKTVITFTGEKFETVTDGKPSESGTVKTDPSKKPKTYTVKITGEFAEKGNTYNGIYKVEGDTLTTCVNTNPGKEAPVEFASKPGTGHQLIVWKRVKQ